MNFLDSYDVTGSTTPVANQPAQSLDEEINQVVGQLSKFWGGFRKQAQKELSKLTTEGSTQQSTSTESSAVAHQPEAGPSNTSNSDEATSTIETHTNVDTDTETTTPRAAPASASSLFSRLQASLPPTLVSSVQTTVQSQLPHLRNAHARANSISAALTAELHKVQTGEFVARSEELLREAGDFLRDAVRVIPPEAQDQSVGIAWDGTDVWMLPTVGETAGKGKERERERSGSRSERLSGEGLRAGATRAEALLKQLRHDPEVIKADPGTDERIREMYATWVKDEVEAKEGGMDSKQWKDAVEKALADEVDGPALAATRDTLVPSEITEEVFWTRYFFRVHQVEQEEEKRKALLQGTTDNDEDFSWEDDDDEATSPATTKPSKHSTEALHLADDSITPTSSQTATRGPGNTLAPPSRTSTPGDASPRRQSSEDSYDVVSSQASQSGAGAETRAGGTPIPEKAEGDKDGDADDADSDWE